MALLYLQNFGWYTVMFMFSWLCYVFRCTFVKLSYHHWFAQFFGLKKLRTGVQHARTHARARIRTQIQNYIHFQLYTVQFVFNKVLHRPNVPSILTLDVSKYRSIVIFNKKRRYHYVETWPVNSRNGHHRVIVFRDTIGERKREFFFMNN